jgi:hypothetical protein
VAWEALNAVSSHTQSGDPQSGFLFPSIHTLAYPSADTTADTDVWSLADTAEAGWAAGDAGWDQAPLGILIPFSLLYCRLHNADFSQTTWGDRPADPGTPASHVVQSTEDDNRPWGMGPGNGTPWGMGVWGNDLRIPRHLMIPGCAPSGPEPIPPHLILPSGAPPSTSPTDGSA